MAQMTEFTDVLHVKEAVDNITSEVQKRIFGQDEVITLVLTTLLSDGHAIFQGVPGTAKTLLAETLAEALDVKANRIQFTADMQPKEITGQAVWDPATNEVHFKEGPIFANFIVADEVNRGRPITNSALLEAMQERRVSVTMPGKQEEFTRELPRPFIVLMTQNPIEQEGTFIVTEAQRDRCLMKITVDYPIEEDEITIALKKRKESSVDKVLSGDELVAIQDFVESSIHISEELVKKVVQLVRMTRPVEGNPLKEQVREYFKVGASPRAPMALVRASKSLAAIRGHDHVTPHEVLDLAFPVLCHRVVFNDEVFEEEYLDALKSGLNLIVDEVFGGERWVREWIERNS